MAHGESDGRLIEPDEPEMVWQTSLVNPDLASYAELCGAFGVRARNRDDVRPAIEAALAHRDGPSLVEIDVSPMVV